MDMKKYLIAIIVILIFMLGGITVIAAKVYSVDYSPNIKVVVENSSAAKSTAHDFYHQSSNKESGATSKENQNAVVSSQNLQSSTVYITPYGLKYHSRKTCAGKNATEIALDSAAKTFVPCAKCVH